MHKDKLKIKLLKETFKQVSKIKEILVKRNVRYKVQKITQETIKKENRSIVNKLLQIKKTKLGESILAR